MAKTEEKIVEEVKETENIERPIQCVCVSDGVYKYIFIDTGEDC